MTEIQKTCCFTGSRPQNLPWGNNENSERCQKMINNLKMVIWNAVKNDGYRHFICGMALGIDIIAARLIIKLRNIKPEFGITLEAAIPCEGQDKYWSDTEKEEYHTLCLNADKQTLLFKKYTKTCMQERNEYMVNNSSLVIAVTDGRSGGTMCTVRYANLQYKKVILITP